MMETLRSLLTREGPRVDEVREALRGVAAPAEAWEVLQVRGLTPSLDLAWSPWTPRDCASCRGRGRFSRFVPILDGADIVMCAECKGLGVEAIPDVEAPDAMELVLALGGDPDGIARCSLLAVEAHSRLFQWSHEITRTPRVVWRAAAREIDWRRGPENTPWMRGARLFDRVTSRVRVAAERRLTSRERREARRVLAPMRDLARSRWALVADIIEAAFWWDQAPHAVIPTTEPCLFEGQRLANVPDPFEPMLDVLRAGHAIDAIVEDAVVLVASPKITPTAR